MTSYSQNDYYYNNENDALSYNSRPISSTNYIKNNSSYGHSTEPTSLKRGVGHQNNSETVNSMYDNYGSVVASTNNGGGVYGGGLRGGGSHYYPNPGSNDNDIYHQQQQQAYNTDSYGRGGYYDDSCDNMSDYGDNRMSGRHSSMSTTAKQLPQIPMKHSSSMVDGISYARGASLPTTPPVAHKKSRMLPQPTANGGIGGSTGKCLPATPRALPQVNSNNKQSPSARSGTGRKLLPTPKQHQQASDRFDTMSTSSYDNVTINNSYNNVRPHSSIPPASYNDDYNNYGYTSSPTPLHQKRPPKIGNADLSSSLDGSTPVATRDLFDSPTINSTTDDNFYETRTCASELSSATTTPSSCLSTGNGCSVGSGRRLPKRLPTPNVKQSNGSGGKQLPKLPPIRNKHLSTASPSATDNVTNASSTYNKSFSSISCTSTSPTMTSTSTSSSSAASNSIHDTDSGYHSSNLYPPSISDSVSSSTSLNSSGYHSSYLQTSKSPSASSKSSATYTAAVTDFYDDDGNTSLANSSYLNNEYHSLKSYPPEITTTSTATVTAAVSATTTTTNKSSSFSVTDYLKKFDIKSALTSSSVSTPKSTASATTNSKLCITCSDSIDCSCFPTSVATTRTVTTSLPNGPLSKLSNGQLAYVPAVISNGPVSISTPLTETTFAVASTPTITPTTTNYSAYISDYLKIYSSSDFNYEGGGTLVDTNVSRKSSISSAVTTTSSTTTTASYITTYLSGDYSSKSDDLSSHLKSPTPTCDHNGCDVYSSKTYDTIDYFSLAATTTDYSEYLSTAKSTVVNTAIMANGDDYSCYTYLDYDGTNSGALIDPPTVVDSKDRTTNYDDPSNYSPTPTVTTIASNDDPYSYLDAYKVDLPVYSTDFGSSSDSHVAETYTEPNYSTTMSQTRLETPSNEFYDDYRSSTATPVGEVSTNFKAYLYETNSNSGSGSGSGSGSSSSAGSDPLLGKHDLTTSSSGTPSSGSTVVPTQQAQISGGYYQPASSKSAPSLNTTSTPQKAASAAASKASSMFGSLSQGLKGGLDGVLSGVAAVADTTKQQQQPKQQSAASGIKSSAKSFGFGFASKLIPNLSGSSEPTKPAQTKPTTTAMTGQKPTTAAITTAPMTTGYDMSYNTNHTTYMNDNQQPYTTMNDYDYSDIEHILTTSSDVSTCGDWNGVVRHSQSIYTTDSLMYDGDFNQGMYENATTTNGGGMMLDDGYDSILTRQSSLDGTQPAVTTAATMNGGGGKIVDYSDDYKYGYDEYSYSENDYIATGDITDNQNYNNNYDYMDDDATIVSQLLDNAAAKMAAESVVVTTGTQIIQTSAATLSSSFDATSGMDMMDAAMKQQTIQVTAAMTTAQQHQQQQLQQQQQVTVTTAATAQPKLGPTSLLSSLTSVATGGQQPQGQQQQPASKTTSSGGGGLFGSFLGKAAAAVQSASQVVSTATAMTTAAVKVVPGTPFAGDQQKNSAQNRHDTEMSNAVSSGAGGAAVVTTTTTSSMDDYENSNLYEDDYYTTSTTTTNTATNANTNLAQKMLPTVPLSSGKKLPAINGKSGLLMKQQPTEIYDEDEEEYIDELDPNYRMDSEQDDYYMDQTAPSTTASMMAVNGYYTPQDGGYDYREDYFNEEDEYKYLEKEQQLKELRKHQQLMKHQKQPPLEYIEESHDDYIDDNYPSEDSANYLMDDMKDHPLQVPVVTTTSASIISVTTPTSGGLIHHQIKKQDSIIEEDEDEALLTPDDSLQHDDQPLSQQFHEDAQIAKKKTLTRGETEEVTSGQLMRKPEITARQRWNWAYNKIIMQLNDSTLTKVGNKYFRTRIGCMKNHPSSQLKYGKQEQNDDASPSSQ